MSILTKLWTLIVCISISAVSHAQFPDYPEPFLPELGTCMNPTAKQLPAKWEAITLMAPYLYTGAPYSFFKLPERASLQAGKFVYDGDEGLMRVTQYGVTDDGEYPLDLLITDGATYVLHEEGSKYQRGWGRRRGWDFLRHWEKGLGAGVQCIGQFSTTYQVPSRIWPNNDLEGTCVGNHPVAPNMDGQSVDWWKQRSPILSPGAEGEAADWYWFDKNGFPVRTMFWGEHDGLPAILGEYAYTNFQKFKPVYRTNLKKLLDKCTDQDLPLMDREQVKEYQRDNPTKDTTQVADLIPGLSYEACYNSNIQAPSWPVEMYITSFSTAAKYDTPKPLPTSVHYQPQVPRIRTRLHKDFFSDALLIGNSSYGVDTDKNTLEQLGCGQGPNTSLPGSPHAYWGNQGGCQCFGVIEGNQVLSRNRTTQLIGCPMPLTATVPGEQEGNTMFWMWYSTDKPAEPVVFLQTHPDVTIGTGLSLADYVYWNPQEISDEVFTLPEPSCVIPPEEAPTPPPGCLKCHITSVNTE